MSELIQLEVHEPELPGTVGDYLPNGLSFVNTIYEPYIFNHGDYVEYPLAHLAKRAGLTNYTGPTIGSLVFSVSEISHICTSDRLRKVIRLRYVKEVGVRFANKPLA